jgi:Papain-like cysteine protease AvrRpt2
MLQFWGLEVEPPQNYSVEAFGELLNNYGPLWVASAEPGPHIRVVTGIVSDGKEDGTLLYVNDPWQKGMEEFKLPNLGSQNIETYFNFVQKQDELASQEQDVPGALYVAHLPRWSPYLK